MITLKTELQTENQVNYCSQGYKNEVQIQEERQIEET
jgi:ribulose bisphosphate carboxylase small subunit